MTDDNLPGESPEDRYRREVARVEAGRARDPAAHWELVKDLYDETKKPQRVGGRLVEPKKVG